MFVIDDSRGSGPYRALHAVRADGWCSDCPSDGSAGGTVLPASDFHLAIADGVHCQGGDGHAQAKPQAAPLPHDVYRVASGSSSSDSDADSGKEDVMSAALGKHVAAFSFATLFTVFLVHRSYH